MQYKQWSVVAASTISFTVCFMVWMMFAVIGIPIKAALNLNETQFGILVAMPVLTGSLIRLPLGMWTDRYGGRIVFFILMLSTVVPIWMISWGTEFWHFLVTGLFVGVAGGSFTVGIAYCARWFPRHRQGLAMGIFGVGNTGAAVTKLVADGLLARDPELSRRLAEHGSADVRARFSLERMADDVEALYRRALSR